MDRPQVRFVDECVLTVSGAAWPFAQAEAEAIDSHWRQRTADNPSYFNGRIFMLSRYAIARGVLSGTLLPVDFKAFLYWKETGQPDRSVYDAFGSALIRSGDGAILLGRQSAGNLNAGLVYLPGGFIDPRDVDEEGRVDIRASVLREVEEETGLSARTLGVREGYLVTTTGQQVSIAVEMVADGDAKSLVSQMRQVPLDGTVPELDEIVAVRTMDDTRALPMPDYARVLLEHLLTGHAAVS